MTLRPEDSPDVQALAHTIVGAVVLDARLYSRQTAAALRTVLRTSDDCALVLDIGATGSIPERASLLFRVPTCGSPAHPDALVPTLVGAVILNAEPQSKGTSASIRLTLRTAAGCALVLDIGAMAAPGESPSLLFRFPKRA